MRRTKGRGMGADWLKDGFNVALVKNLPEIKRIVTGICRHYGCLQHVDDVCSEVLLHIQLQYLNHPTYFESKQHLLAYAGQGARFCLWHIFREMRRLEFRDPRELPESLTRRRGRARMTSLRVIGKSYSRCSRIASRPFRCSRPRALSFAKFSCSTARGRVARKSLRSWGRRARPFLGACMTPSTS